MIIANSALRDSFAILYPARARGIIVKHNEQTIHFQQPFYLQSTPNSAHGVPTLWRSSWLSEEEPWNCRQILSRRRRGSEPENV